MKPNVASGFVGPLKCFSGVRYCLRNNMKSQEHISNKIKKETFSSFFRLFFKKFWLALRCQKSKIRKTFPKRGPKSQIWNIRWSYKKNWRLYYTQVSPHLKGIVNWMKTFTQQYSHNNKICTTKQWTSGPLGGPC